MPHNVTVTLQDGAQHTYQNVPDSVTPDAINQRALKEFSQSVTNIDGGAKAAPKPERSLLGAIGEGAMNLIPHAVDAWHTATVDVPDALLDPTKRKAVGQSLAAIPGQIADTAKGYMQQVRELSPEQYRGSAAPMDKAAALKMEAGIPGKFGVDISPKRLAAALQGDLGEPNLNAYRTMKDTIAEHPLAVAATVAPAAKFMPHVPVPKGASVFSPKRLAEVLDAGATPAAENVRKAALAKVLTQQQAAEAAATEAATKKAADAPLRATMDAAAADQAAQGIGVSDVPEAQDLVAELNLRLNPNGPVATTPTTGQTAAYKAVIETLAPSKGPKPSLEMVQNLRRELADAAYGGADPRGFGAISKLDKRYLVKRLHEIEDAYTGGASTPVRENWSAAMTAQEKADDMAKLKNTLQTDAVQMDLYKGPEAVKRAKAIVSKLSNKGLVPDNEYREFLELANAATDAQGKSAFRKKAALYGAGLVGASAGGVAIGGHALGVLP